MSNPELDVRKIGRFLGLAFGISWLSALAIYLAGAGNLLVAPVGVAGIVAALAATVACLVHDRYVATERITTGEPLSPWT